MYRNSRVRQVLVAAGIGSPVFGPPVGAGGASTSGTYKAPHAKLVPASYKNVTLQVATDATYAPDESMKGTTMIGFDVDLMKAVATTLKVKINENNVTFDGIIAGIKGGRYQIGNSSFTDNKAREKSVNFVDYFPAGGGVDTKQSSQI